MFRRLYLLFCIFPFFISAQSVSISEPLQLKNDLAYFLVGDLDDRSLLIRERPSEVIVQAFEKNLRQSWEKEIQLDKFRAEILDVISNEQGFSLIYRFKNKGQTFIKLHKYDPAANLTDSVTIKNLGALFFNPNIKLVLSENKKLALIYEADQLERFNVFVINLETAELLYEQTIEPDNFIFKRDFVDILPDNSGNFYLVLDRNNRKLKIDQHHFEVFKFGPDFPNILIEKHDFKNMLSLDIGCSVDNIHHNLVISGTYSDDSPMKSKGYFFYTIPPSGTASTLTHFDFSEDDAKAIMGKKYSENKGIADLKVRDIVHRSDGGILFIAEKTKIFERQTGGYSRGGFDRFNRRIIDFYIEDLFIASIHPDGQLHWSGVLHKKQYSQDDGGIYSSYFLMKSPENLRVVYNDEIKPNNTASEYVISPQGKIERKSVLSTDLQNLKLRFRDALQVSAHEFLVPSERRSKLKLVRIAY